MGMEIYQQELSIRRKFVRELCTTNDSKQDNQLKISW